jgi:uncharacterized RDD family membrane protein YckC
VSFCPNCGASLAQGSAFCASCGTAVAAEAAQPLPGVTWPEPVTAPSPVGVALPAGVQISSAGRRLGAWALDVLLLIVTLFIGWLVWSLIIWGRGQSPGKQLLHMRVVYLQSGAHVSWGRMAFREVICKGVIGIVAGITLIGYILYFWLLWDAKRQELWDKMADTIVVDDPRDALA